MKPELVVTIEHYKKGVRVSFENDLGQIKVGTIEEVEGHNVKIREEGTSKMPIVGKIQILSLRYSVAEENQRRLQERSKYGRSSKVTFAHTLHRVYDEMHETCEFCQKENKQSEAQRERQETRVNGQYSAYCECEYVGCKHKSSKVARHAAVIVPEDGWDASNGIVMMHKSCAKEFFKSCE